MISGFFRLYLGRAAEAGGGRLFAANPAAAKSVCQSTAARFLTARSESHQ